MNTEWLEKAIETVKSGAVDKIIKDNVAVYKAGENLVRIDVEG